MRSVAVSDVCEPGAKTAVGGMCSIDVQCGRGHVLSKTLSVDVDSAVNAVNIPFTCLVGMWLKAAKLLHEEHTIVPAPH